MFLKHSLSFKNLLHRFGWNQYTPYSYAPWNQTLKKYKKICLKHFTPLCIFPLLAACCSCYRQSSGQLYKLSLRPRPNHSSFNLRQAVAFDCACFRCVVSVVLYFCTFFDLLLLHVLSFAFVMTIYAGRAAEQRTTLKTQGRPPYWSYKNIQHIPNTA